MKKALNIEDKPTSSSSKADPIKFVYTNESAVDCIRQSSLAEYSESLKDSNWKLRLEGICIIIFNFQLSIFFMRKLKMILKWIYTAK